MNQALQGILQRSRLQCRTTWTRALPKTQGKVGLYTSTQFKNWSDM